MPSGVREKVRKPCVAGVFYPFSADELRRECDAFLGGQEEKVRAKGIVVPHAGITICGQIAGAVYGRIEPPDTAILIGPDHYLAGGGVSLMTHGRWEIPGGVAVIDGDLANRVNEELASGSAGNPGLSVVEGARAHEREHSLEVQLPFLLRIRSGKRGRLRILPILMQDYRPAACRALGKALGKALADRPDTWTLVGSTDFNHEEPHEVALRKDQMAIDAILQLDPEGLLEVVDREDVRMCGHGPVATVLTACAALGAERAELVGHMTSGVVTGDFDRVVGYAGILIH
jgi:AmmeMemoRadiSam system protein B